MSLGETGHSNRYSYPIIPAGNSLFAPAEADVMRLVAVLSLCLMLLFAADQHFSSPIPENDDAVPDVLPELAEDVRQDDLAEQHPESDSITMTTVVEPAAASSDTQADDPGSTTTADSALPSNDHDSAGQNGALELVFASDAVFLRLMIQGRVTLYLIEGDRWYQVTLADARRSEIPTGYIYGMQHNTVPQALRRRAPDSDSGVTARWAVQLSTDIQKDIETHLQTRTHQKLVIESSGEVRGHANGVPDP